MTKESLERYIELDNNPYLWGRIKVGPVASSFMAEVDIIYKETHKIFKHVTILYAQPSEEEALILGIQKLREYLLSLENHPR